MIRNFLFLMILTIAVSAEPAGRFIHEKGYVRDTTHHLLWQDTDAVAKNARGWHEAKAYCTNLEIGGIRGWRLPTEEELLGIVDFMVIDPAIYTVFKVVVSEDYWTAQRNGEKAKSVYFGSGCTNDEDLRKKLWVRCVKTVPVGTNR